ncbi:MAG: transcription elongation factor GreB [Pseudomonadales bacterium]
MGRYRKPQPHGSRYITPAGEQTLRAELQYLWKEERPKVTDAVSEAAKQGDRSENGDYIYGKRRLAEIDRRVRYLRKRLDEMQVVDQPPANKNIVYFGAYVTLQDDGGASTEYQIVGPDEFDLSAGKLSMDSPLAKALLGKKLDEEFELQRPAGTTQYLVTAIRYSH